jgi:hypothetical protein
MRAMKAREKTAAVREAKEKRCNRYALAARQRRMEIWPSRRQRWEKAM